MNAGAINPLYSYARNQRASLYPMGQSDQTIINSMKLGSRRNHPVTMRPNFTVWAAPVLVYATAS